MLKVENCTDITLEMLIKLNEAIGLTVDINDGQITSANFCSKSTEN